MRKLLVAAFFCIASTASAQRSVATTTGNTATLSGAIKVGDILYVSGQIAGTREAPMDSTIQGQTRQVLDKVKAIVEGAGGKMENVAKCTVFLVNLADFQGMNASYREYWPKEPPARSTVVVAALVSPGAKLELECIASLK